MGKTIWTWGGEEVPFGLPQETYVDREPPPDSQVWKSLNPKTKLESTPTGFGRDDLTVLWATARLQGFTRIVFYLTHGPNPKKDSLGGGRVVHHKPPSLLLSDADFKAINEYLRDPDRGVSYIFYTG